MTTALSKEKYAKILSKKGLSTALTRLHYELRDMEYECFEGREGYQPDLYEKMKELRLLSLELWENRYDSPAQTEEN